jgi:hypothetical protein
MLGGNAVLRARVAEALVERLAFPQHGREVGALRERAAFAPEQVVSRSIW